MADSAYPAPAPHLPEGVRLGRTPHGTLVEIETPAAQAAVHLLGGQVLRWAPAGEREVLWAGNLDATAPHGAQRGGVPLIGPWFGPGARGDAPWSHGWLRTESWTLVSAERTGDAIELAHSVEREDRGARATARYRIGHELDIQLELTALAPLSDVEAALHTYLAVEDVHRVRLDGLGGVEYLDNLTALAAHRQHHEVLLLDGPIDRVYAHAGAVRIRDEAAGRTIVSEPRGTAQTVVWNPWEEAAAQLTDVPPGQWTRFLCVEPAVAKASARDLATGESLMLGVTYRLER